MAIGTDDAILKFGSETTLDAGGSGTAAVSAGAFSASSDAETWTNSDDAPRASFVLTTASGQGAFTAGDVIGLFARLLNINSTADAPQPDANYPHMHLGDFALDAVSGVQDAPLLEGIVDLPAHKSGQEYEFYIENTATPTLAATWTIQVTPVTEGPHA